MKVIVLLVCVLALASATPCGPDSSFDCEGEFVITAESRAYDSIPESFPMFPQPIVEYANETVGVLALQSGSNAEISISVKEITDWIARGGSNPVETGIIRKILTFLNSAGISIQGGSLVYQFRNGPEMELAGGCTDVHLQGGWNAHASLKPGFKVTLSFGVNDFSLVVGSQVYSDCDFAMGARIKARFGKKIFGKCIRALSKTESVNIGAYMVMNIVSRLELKPTFNIDAQLNVILGLAPVYQIRGDLIKFEPTGKVSITIFGIHIGFIERAIANGIRDGMKRAFTQKTVDDQFRAATDAVQKSLNSVLGGMKIVIPLIPPALKAPIQNAVNNINQKQRDNM